MASQDNSRLEQVPPSLRRAHFAARWAWKWFVSAFGAVQRIFELTDDCEDDEDAEFLKEFSACCECAVGLILDARLRLARVDRCLKRVGDEFAGGWPRHTAMAVRERGPATLDCYGGQCSRIRI